MNSRFTLENVIMALESAILNKKVMDAMRDRAEPLPAELEGLEQDDLTDQLTTIEPLLTELEASMAAAAM